MPLDGDFVFGVQSTRASDGVRYHSLEAGGDNTIGTWTPANGAEAGIVPYVVGDKIVAVYGHKAQVLSYTTQFNGDIKQYVFSEVGPEFTIDSNTYPDDIVVHGNGFLAVWREGTTGDDIVGQFFTANGLETGLFTRGDSDGGVGVDAGGTDTFSGNVLTNDLPETGGGKAVTAVDGKAVGTGATAIVGTYGTLTISANGQYSYKADRPAAIALTEEQSVQELFTYRAKTDDGDDDTAQISFNVNGVFDGGARNIALSSDTVAENRAPGSEVGRITAQGEEAFTYALVNNTGKPFKIDANGVITTTTSLDREATASYSVTVNLTGDRSGVATQKTFTIGVTDVNEAPSKPTFTSAYKKDGFGFYELTTKSTGTFGKLAAVDPEGGTVTYVASVKAFNGGAYSDSTKFKVVGNELRVNGALADDFYYISVSAKDAAGNLSQVSTINIDVDAPNAPPVIAGAASASVDAFENSKTVTTIKATDKDVHATLTYSLSGSADKAFFNLDAKSGVLTFKAAPNFEAPKDAGKNNVYDVIVKVTDGTDSDTQAIAVKVGDVNEFAPVIAGAASASISMPENGKTVTTVKATDSDKSAVVTYSLSGGADKAAFNIDAKTGVLTFKTAPDFEAPKDAGRNNVYDVIVKASDGTKFDTQTLAVKVTDVGGPAKGAPVAHGDTFAFTKAAAAIDPGGADAGELLCLLNDFFGIKDHGSDASIRVVEHGGDDAGAILHALHAAKIGAGDLVL